MVYYFIYYEYHYQVHYANQSQNHIPFENTLQKLPLKYLSSSLLNPLLEISPSGNPPISPNGPSESVSPLESASSF